MVLTEPIMHHYIFLLKKETRLREVKELALWYFFKIYFIYLCVCAHICVFVCVHVCVSTCRGWKRVLDPRVVFLGGRGQQAAVFAV